MPNVNSAFRPVREVRSRLGLAPLEMKDMKHAPDIELLGAILRLSPGAIQAPFLVDRRHGTLKSCEMFLRDTH